MTDVTIVIPSYNQAKFLPATLDSVLRQEQAPPMQVIIIDGGSTDGTLDILHAIDDPRVTWTSEPDHGQTHAINKGMARATGDIVAWLNSDDLYEPRTLRTVVDAFNQHPAAQWLVGRAIIVNAEGCEIRRPITRYKDRKLRRYSFRSLLRQNFICQMSVFWRRSFAEHIGPLDENLHYTMDYQYWLRMGSRCDPLVLDRVLARFRWHDASKTGSINRRQFDEQYENALPYFGADWVSRAVHRFNVEKIVWSYRLLKLLGK